MIKNFTGIDSPYERPEHPDIVIPSNELSIDEATSTLLNSVLNRIAPQQVSTEFK
jgi:adenylylsulfate kinase-like enzyme